MLSKLPYAGNDTNNDGLKKNRNIREKAPEIWRSNHVNVF